MYRDVLTKRTERLPPPGRDRYNPRASVGGAPGGQARNAATNCAPTSFAPPSSPRRGGPNRARIASGKSWAILLVAHRSLQLAAAAGVHLRAPSRAGAAAAPPPRPALPNLGLGKAQFKLTQLKSVGLPPFTVKTGGYGPGQGQVPRAPTPPEAPPDGRRAFRPPSEKSLPPSLLLLRRSSQKGEGQLSNKPSTPSPGGLEPAPVGGRRPTAARTCRQEEAKKPPSGP